MRLRVSPLLLAALSALSVTSASADQARRPFRTEFGPSERDELRGDQLVLSGGTYGGADDTSLLAGAAVQDDSLQSGRTHQGGNLSLQFVRRRPRLAVTATGNSAVRYYHSLNRIGTQRHSVGGSGEWAASRTLTVVFGQNVTYSPSYHLALTSAPDITPEEAPEAPSLDFDLSRSKQFVYGSFASARYVLSPGREITAGYSLSYTNFLGRLQSDYGMQQAAAKFKQQLTRFLALNLGYGLGSGTGTGLSEGKRHLLDVGLGFDRSLSFSPRTTVGFSSGSAIVNVNGSNRFELIGNINVRRLLSPRWTTSAAYERALTAIDGVASPFTSNTLNAAVTGFLGSRTSVTIRPSYTWGSSVADEAQTFHNSTSVARVETAISRHWAAFAEYMFYDHSFSRIPGLRPSLAVDTRRQGLRTGVSLWSPLR